MTENESLFPMLLYRSEDSITYKNIYGTPFGRVYDMGYLSPMTQTDSVAKGTYTVSRQPLVRITRRRVQSIALEKLILGCVNCFVYTLLELSFFWGVLTSWAYFLPSVLPLQRSRITGKQNRSEYLYVVRTGILL